jgi:cellulose biosynthesis protein BcsQ
MFGIVVFLSRAFWALFFCSKFKRYLPMQHFIKKVARWRVDTAQQAVHEGDSILWEVERMAKINIVLADFDELYLNKLADYFMEKAGMFDVCSFTSKESLGKYISDRQNKVDIILFAEELSDEAINAHEIPVKIFLSDGTFSGVTGFETVNKYQKTEKLVNTILMIYAEKTGRVEAVTTGDKKTKVIGVYSPVGGCGKTTMALALAMDLAGRGKRVFYLNYEIINSTTELLNTAPGGSLSDVLLAVKTKGANVGLRVMANKYADSATKISFINPPESALEINELTVAEQIRLIRELDALGEFDAVIVDFDSGFSASKADLLDVCDAILMPFTEDGVSLGKIRLLMNEFRMHGELDGLFRKIHLAVNKINSNINTDLQQVGISSVKPVEVAMPLSPTAADIRNLSYAVSGMRAVFENFVTGVLE